VVQNPTLSGSGPYWGRGGERVIRYRIERKLSLQGRRAPGGCVCEAALNTVVSAVERN
jgi:hypothetical protein